MDELLKKLRDYSRFLELEDSIPYWEGQIPEMKAKIRELKTNRDNKEIDLQRMENPGIFQRLFGGSGGKQERLKQQLSQYNAAWTAAKWDLEQLEKKIAAGQQERDALADSREVYIAAKENATLNAARESRLIMEEIAAFTPLALTLAERTQQHLEEALLLGATMEVKTEFLNHAAENAKQLREILSIMPEGCADIGGYLLNPQGFIYATAAKYGPQNRMHLAAGQIRTVVNQLKALIGE